MAVRPRMRSFVRGNYGIGIFGWLDRVVYRHGLFDLRAAVAGKILGVNYSNGDEVCKQREIWLSGFAAVRNKERS
jgi:hypothetical protein